MAATNVRLHFKDGHQFTESLVTLAHGNGVTVAQARKMLDLWVRWGDLVRRPDGGYDVRRKRPRKDPQTLAALAALDA